MFKVIAISGYKFSGKDTSADYLVKSYNAKKFSFAAALKDLVAKQYNIPREWCDDPEHKEKPLLMYPVKPADQFSEYIFNHIAPELKFNDGGSLGEEATKEELEELKSIYIECNREKMLTVQETLYHTPRSLCILEGGLKRSVDSNYWVSTIIKNINEDCRKNSKGLFVISDLRFKSELQELHNHFGDNLITARVDRFEKASSDDISERDLDTVSFDVVLRNKGTLAEFEIEVLSKIEHKINNE